MCKVCVQKPPANGKKAENEFGHATETGKDCTDVKVRGQSGTGHEVGGEVRVQQGGGSQSDFARLCDKLVVSACMLLTGRAVRR